MAQATGNFAQQMRPLPSQTLNQVSPYNNPAGWGGTVGNPTQFGGPTAFSGSPRLAPGSVIGTPLQQALGRYMLPAQPPVPGVDQQQTLYQQLLRHLMHPFANAGVGGQPWKNPALQGDIKGYEKSVKEMSKGGFTKDELKKLEKEKQTLQDEARRSWMSGMNKAATGKGVPGDAFQDVLRDMMTKMLGQV